MREAECFLGCFRLFNRGNSMMRKIKIFGIYDGIQFMGKSNAFPKSLTFTAPGLYTEDHSYNRVCFVEEYFDFKRYFIKLLSHLI